MDGVRSREPVELGLPTVLDDVQQVFQESLLQRLAYVAPADAFSLEAHHVDDPLAFAFLDYWPLHRPRHLALKSGDDAFVLEIPCRGRDCLERIRASLHGSVVDKVVCVS